MSARVRWQVLNYGPGVILVAFAVVAFVGTGEVWTLAIGLAGGAQIAQTTLLRYLYRSAYFRGRAEQLRDLSDGTWPDPTKLDPQPWERPGETLPPRTRA